IEIADHQVGYAVMVQIGSSNYLRLETNCKVPMCLKRAIAVSHHDAHGAWICRRSVERVRDSNVPGIAPGEMSGYQSHGSDTSGVFHMAGEGSCAAVHQNAHAVGWSARLPGIGDDEVGPVLAVKILDGNRLRSFSSVIVGGRLQCAISLAKQNGNLVRIRQGNH